MKQSVGFRYLDYQYKEQMVWGFCTREGKEYYVVNDPNKDDDRAYGALISESDMDTLISKQGEFKQGIIRQQERAKARQLQELDEQEKRREKENLFGFDAKLTPMQRGKILKSLMKEINYRNEEGKAIYGATRKGFILYLISIGYVPEEYSRQEQKKVANYNNACGVRSMEWEDYIKHGFEMHYTINNSQVNTYDITKTEYQFAKYLIDTKQVS